MAKRRSRRSSEYDTSTRDVFTVASPLRRSIYEFDLRPVEDRREYHPERAARPVRSVSGGPVRTQVKRGRSYDPFVMSRLSFDVPERVAVCVRRKSRREVLFATGKGGSRVKRPRRTWRSNIGCS